MDRVLIMNPSVSLICEKNFSNFFSEIGSSTSWGSPTNKEADSTLLDAACLITWRSSVMIVSLTNVGWCPCWRPEIPVLRESLKAGVSVGGEGGECWKDTCLMRVAVDEERGSLSACRETKECSSDRRQNNEGALQALKTIPIGMIKED